MVAKLRFGFYQMPANEVALVKAFFRLFSTRPDFPWEISETGPVDVVLSEQLASAMPAGLCRPTTVVLRVLERGDQGLDENSLTRPLRSDHLESWLLKFAARVGDDAMRPSINASISPVPEKAIIRMKLVRWPPALLLHKDPGRIRLATMLMKRALSITEMSKISSWPVGQCESFIEALRSVGLIQNIPVSANAPVVKANVGGGAAMPLSDGFFARFRRKLGL